MNRAARLFTVVAAALAVAGCAFAPRPTDPLEQAKVQSYGCRSDLAAVAQGDPKGLARSLISCTDVLQWAGALAKEPTAMELQDGDVPTVAHLTEACNGRDSLSVCADAIKKGLVEETGNDNAVVDTPLEVAVRACAVPADKVVDHGMSLTLSTGGKESVGDATVRDVVCVLDELEAPNYVEEHIYSTRALDGQQSDTWGDWEVRWTYHPDSGLRITVIDRSQ